MMLTADAAGVPAGARMHAILADAARLPSPPALVFAVLSSLEDERARVEVVAQHAARDQALTARLLRVANSSFYGVAGGVATVRDAMVVLGLANVRNITVATELIAAFPAAGGRSLVPFWRHGLATAVCAAALARRCGADESVAFTAGILHDLGKLVLAHAGEAVVCAPHGGAALEAERERFGAHHAALGAALAVRWRFPAPICEALSAHHSDAAADPLARLVGHADRLAHALLPEGPSAAALRLCADALIDLRARDTAPALLAEALEQTRAALDILLAG